MAKRGKYTGSGYSIDVKETLAAIGYGLREEGWTVPAVHDLYKRAGFSVGEETLRGWTQAAGRGEPIISPAKQAGAEKKLDEEQRRVAAGCELAGPTPGSTFNGARRGFHEYHSPPSSSYVCILVIPSTINLISIRTRPKNRP
jgi:hypothetical protein